MPLLTPSSVMAPDPATKAASSRTPAPDVACAASAWERRVIPPPRVVIGALTLTSPVPLAWPEAGSLATRETAPPWVAMAALTCTWRPAWADKPTLLAVRVTGARNRMSRVAFSCTVPVTAARAATLTKASESAKSAKASTSDSGTVPACSRSIRMSRGSSSSKPAWPFSARRSTVAKNRRLCPPDTSTKPPSPPAAPPRALMLP